MLPYEGGRWGKAGERQGMGSFFGRHDGRANSGGSRYSGHEPMRAVNFIAIPKSVSITLVCISFLCGYLLAPYAILIWEVLCS
jgi:hypothetical protein